MANFPKKQESKEVNHFLPQNISTKPSDVVKEVVYVVKAATFKLPVYYWLIILAFMKSWLAQQQIMRFSKGLSPEVHNKWNNDLAKAIAFIYRDILNQLDKLGFKTQRKERWRYSNLTDQVKVTLARHNISAIYTMLLSNPKKNKIIKRFFTMILNWLINGAMGHIDWGQYNEMCNSLNKREAMLNKVTEELEHSNKRLDKILSVVNNKLDTKEDKDNLEQLGCTQERLDKVVNEFVQVADKSNKHLEEDIFGSDEENDIDASMTQDEKRQ